MKNKIDTDQVDVSNVIDVTSVVYSNTIEKEAY